MRALPTFFDSHSDSARNRLRRGGTMMLRLMGDVAWHWAGMLDLSVGCAYRLWQVVCMYSLSRKYARFTEEHMHMMYMHLYVRLDLKQFIVLPDGSQCKESDCLGNCSAGTVEVPHYPFCSGFRRKSLSEAAYSDVFSTQDGVWAWSAVLGSLASMVSSMFNNFAKEGDIRLNGMTQ